MPLQHVDMRAVRSPDMTGVGFPMMKPDASRISVIVSDTTLQDIAFPPPSEDQDLIDRCEEYRGHFEMIASGRFAAGQTTGPIRI